MKCGRRGSCEEPGQTDVTVATTTASVIPGCWMMLICAQPRMALVCPTNGFMGNGGREPGVMTKS